MTPQQKEINKAYGKARRKRIAAEKINSGFIFEGKTYRYRKTCLECNTDFLCNSKRALRCSKKCRLTPIRKRAVKEYLEQVSTAEGRSQHNEIRRIQMKYKRSVRQKESVA